MSKQLGVARWRQALVPAAAPLSRQEAARSVLAALLGLGLMEVILAVLPLDNA